MTEDAGVGNLIEASLEDGKLPCAVAFRVAERAVVEPLTVGQAADALGVRISRCQLGLFGYGDKLLGKHRIVKPMTPVPLALETALRAASVQGRIACEDTWRIAGDLALPKLAVSGACEALGLKVVRCQLGCF